MSAAARFGVPLQIAALGAMWGSAFLFIKVALRDLGPLEVAFGRLGVGAAVLVLLVAAAGAARGPLRLPRQASAWRLIGVLALLTAVLPFLLIAAAIDHLPSTAGAVTNAVTPLFTAFLAIALGRELRPPRLRLAGIAIGFAGVVVMFGAGFSGGPALARVALVAAALAYAGGFVLARSHRIEGTPPLVVAACQLTLAAALMLPVAALATDTRVTGEAALAVLALGVVSTGLPAILYFHLVRTAGSTSASLATYVVPPVGVALGWLFLGESLAPSAVLGALIVIAGIVLAERVPAKRLTKEPA